MTLIMQTSRSQTFGSALKYASLPLLAAIYPALFHYANNAHLVLLSSVLELCLLLVGIGLGLYMLWALIVRGKFPQVAIGAFLMLLFFHSYGLAFEWLRSLDLFQVEIYNFLPFWVFAALYLAWLAATLKTDTAVLICNISLLILGVLAAFNLIKIIPAELEKSRTNPTAIAASLEEGTAVANQRYPDIYYLVFDEAAGFEVARRYWPSPEVDGLVSFLEGIGFYVAEESHGESIHTLHEISTRLNYEKYPIGDEYFEIYNKAIGNNAVMAYLKELGYTIIAYDERRTPYPTMLPVPADILIEESPDKNAGRAVFLDDYKILVLQSTMLRSFLNQDPELHHHRNMILYTSENIASEHVPSPRFVYAHLMLPHGPFIFSGNGTITVSGRSEHFNWQRYPENYKFFLSVAQLTVNNIVSETKGNAVIILQSDHGARNFTESPYIGSFQNFPEEYKTWIVNAVYLPNCDDAPLTQDLDPINTFPIVFNCYFDTDIPLQ